ncbi:hypothetical protein B0H12DRAFT_1114509 [Mycena haematopus]|nr:hypothetical protein B0H12DRAFT_1114509 [Mycena haematopus]
MMVLRLAAWIFHCVFFSWIVSKSSNWCQEDIDFVTTTTALVRPLSTNPEDAREYIDFPTADVKSRGSLRASGVIESHDATRRMTLGYIWRPPGGKYRSL